MATRTAEGNERTYAVKWDSVGATNFINTGEDGLVSTIRVDLKGITTSYSPDGTTTVSEQGPDPRFGMDAPIIKNSTVTTPSGLQLKTTHNRVITQYTGAAVTGLSDTVAVNGNKWITNYDGNQHLFTAISPEGRETSSYTDTLGRVIQSSVPGVIPVNYTYDSSGFITNVDQGSRHSKFTYNSQGYLETATDPEGRSETTYYDSAGRVTTQILPNGQQILYSYDANGNLTSITPPGRPAHTFEYNNVDLNDKYTPPIVPDSAGATKYVYNLDKQLISTIFPDSSKVNIIYDTASCGCGSLSRPSKIISDHGTTSFAYDSATGNLKSVTSPDGEATSYKYDGSLLTQINSNGIVNGTVGFTYNNDFNVVSSNVNGLDTTKFTYDNDGLLTGAGNLSINYNPQNGFVTGTALGNINSSYQYNAYGEVDSSTYNYDSTQLYNSFYTRDSLGRITSLKETIKGVTNTYNYEYNTIGYLVQVKKNGVVTSQYVYDQNGNRIKYISNNDTVNAAYDNQDRMLTYGNTVYVYGKRGDLQEKITGTDTTKYEYDNLGNLRKVTLPNGTLIEYLVDGQNRRIAKLVNGTVVKKWLYSNGLLPVAELDSANNVKVFYGPGYIVKNDTTYRVITDHLGSVRLIVNTVTGAVVQKMNYDEFGNISSLQNGNEFTDFTFAGGLYDSDTKLIRFGARDYDPAIGRWTCKDPILFDGGLSNLYEYVVNDPINKFDPYGLQNVHLETLKETIEKINELYEEYKEYKNGKKEVSECSNINPKDYNISDKELESILSDLDIIHKKINVLQGWIWTDPVAVRKIISLKERIDIYVHRKK